MLILLPPSEGKSAPDSGPRLDLAALTYPTLRSPRARVVKALIETCTNSPGRAATLLGLGPSQGDWVLRNTHLKKAPTAPASEIYTGVLFEALDLSSLTGAQHRKARERIAIASALFGLVGIDDHIPAYRLSGDTRLPHLSLKETWNSPVAAILSATSGIVVDMRSGAYAALAPLSTALADRAVTVKVVTSTGATVSHHNKATKGHLTRSLATLGRVPRSIDALVSAIRAEGFTAELDEKDGVNVLAVVTS